MYANEKSVSSVVSISKVRRLQKSEQPQMLNIKDAQVNLAYQRSPEDRKPLLQKIANKFAWSKFGAILLHREKSGALYIIDGAGRHYIVYTLLGLNCEVPCVVVNDLPVESQARLFVEINQDQKHPNSGDIFKARVSMKDPIAVGIKACADQFGLTIGQHSGAKNIASVQSVETIYHRGCAGNKLEAVFAIKKNEWKDEVAGGGYLEGIDLFLRAEPNCDVAAFRKVLGKTPVATITLAVKRAAGGESPKKCAIPVFAAKCLAEAYNKNRKKHRASLDRILRQAEKDTNKA